MNERPGRKPTNRASLYKLGLITTAPESSDPRMRAFRGAFSMGPIARMTPLHRKMWYTRQETRAIRDIKTIKRGAEILSEDFRERVRAARPLRPSFYEKVTPLARKVLEHELKLARMQIMLAMIQSKLEVSHKGHSAQEAKNLARTYQARIARYRGDEADLLATLNDPAKLLQKTKQLARS